MTRFIFSLLLVIPFKLTAQQFDPDADWRFENFSTQNHFINRGVDNLTVDNYGYVWVCSNGLFRFDGYKITDFSKISKKETGLKSNDAGTTIDDKGRVWVTSAGLCYYDNAGNKFVYVQPGPDRKISAVSVFVSSKNYLWFVSEYGLGKLDLTSLKISFTSLSHINDPLSIYFISDTTLFVSSREKVYTYNIKNDKYSSYTLTHNNQLVKVFAMAQNNTSTYLATNFGVFRLEYTKGLTLVSEGPDDVSVNDMLFLPGDKEKKYLFIATEGKGLIIYNTLSKKIEFNCIHSADNPYSLPSNSVTRIVADKKGRLWLGTALGVAMLDLADQEFKMRFLNKNNSEVLGVNKVARDRYDSTKVWMSSYNLGMICVDWGKKSVQNTYEVNAKKQHLYDFVQVAKDKWILATQKKIMEWSPRAGVLYEEKLPLSDAAALICNIHSLILAGDNTCFITTNKGLFRYDLLTRRIEMVSTGQQQGKAEDAYQHILLNGFFDNDQLWIASRNGLFNYDITKKITTVYTGKADKANYFLFDITKAGGNIVCASGKGLLIFNRQTKNFSVVNNIGNLLNPSCISIANINHTIFAGTASGILSYNVDTKASAVERDENAMMQAIPTSPFTTVGGDIVFGFGDGYAWLRPDQKRMVAPSDPVIEGVYVNNKRLSQPDAGAPGSTPVVLNHQQNSINIAFTAFFYPDADRVKFRCKLIGADPQWQDVDDQRSANYAQLQPGHYTFYVQCGDRNGKWNDHLASFIFTIQPPYWETLWFRALVVVLIAAGLYRLYRYRIKNILAIQKIRERIASDFHDDIGAALSSISIFSEVADTQLEEKLPHEQTREIVGHISHNSRAMLDAMDDIIWAVNPRNDHFNDLAVRMCEFAIPLLEARNIQFDIDIPDELLNTRVKMETRKNIFLIFKECINNILKHAACTAMKVAVNRTNSQVELVISDNGRGFDVTALTNRNGLKNMQKRAAEINGDIIITSQPGQGTVTRLVIVLI